MPIPKEVRKYGSKIILAELRTDGIPQTSFLLSSPPFSRLLLIGTAKVQIRRGRGGPKEVESFYTCKWPPCQPSANQLMTEKMLLRIVMQLIIPFSAEITYSLADAENCGW
jgi:hypothetical protein